MAEEKSSLTEGLVSSGRSILSHGFDLPHFGGRKQVPSIHPWNKMLKEQRVVGRLGDASSGAIQMALEEAERCVWVTGCLKMFQLVI